MNVRKAVILAGGAGTRLYPVTFEIPKPLLTVHRKPIINYLIELFRKHGVSDIKLVVRAEDREEFLWWLKRWGGAFGKTVISFEEESRPMGTMGYWFHHLQAWTAEEPFFVTNGDELKEADLGAMAEHHAKHGGAATLALVSVERPREYGIARLDGSRILEFVEKPENPPSNLANSGLYLLDPSMRSYLAGIEKKEHLMAEYDLFPALARKGVLIGFPGVTRWYDCGNLERWERAIKEWPQGGV